MKNTISTVLLTLNIIFTLGIGGYLLYNSGKNSNAQPADTSAQPITLDTSETQASIVKLTSKVDGLTSTVQRFNTSLIQYDFLKEEMGRLATIDQAIGVRAQAINRAKNEENAAQVDTAIVKLNQLSQQVQGQQQVRRQTMLKLIAGLEKQLALITGTPLAKPLPQIPQPAIPVAQPQQPAAPKAPTPKVKAPADKPAPTPATKPTASTPKKP